MINKIFVFLGLAVSAILAIENLVTQLPAYVFIDSSSSTFMLSIVSTIVGVFIGYGLRGILEKDTSDTEDYNF